MNGWGGARNRKFSEEQLEEIKVVLWELCKANPTIHIQEYQKEIGRKLDIAISATSIRRIFKKWRWSWKNVEYKQINKYTHENIINYGNYLLWLNSQHWKHLKYLDEAHFVNRGMIAPFLISHTCRFMPETGIVPSWSPYPFDPIKKIQPW